MSKLTLIEIVQEIMNDIDGDYVNSISDTDEALQVASIVRSTFFDIIYRKDWPHLRKVGQLQSLNDNAYPEYLKLPERLFELEELRYDKSRKNDERTLIERVKYKEPAEFLTVLAQHNNTSDNVTEYTSLDGVTFFIRTDRPPTYYTSFDDEHLVFDSFDSEVEDTLQGDRAQAIYLQAPTFEMSDGFIADLPHEAFRGFVEEAKSAASLKIRQVQDIKAEVNAQKHSARAAQRGRRAGRGNRYPDYGRNGTKGRTGYYGSPRRDKWATGDDS